MKSFQLGILILAAAGMIGCVQSVHPFIKESQYTYDPSLAGKWADEDGNVIAITGDQATNQYSAVTTEKDSKTGTYVIHMAKVQNHTLLDVAPGELPLENASDTYKAYFMPTHSFLLLDKTPTGLSITSMDADWAKKFIQANPNALAHLELDDRVVLTAPTDQLQDFIFKHIDTDGAYGKPTEFKRVDSPATKP